VDSPQLKSVSKAHWDIALRKNSDWQERTDVEETAARDDADRLQILTFVSDLILGEPSRPLKVDWIFASLYLPRPHF